MFLINGKRLAVLSIFCLLIACSSAVFAQDKEWREVTPAELAMKIPKVEADADAEAIFWEVRIDDSSEDLALRHYLRVKIFTERGREKYSKVDIPYAKGTKIKDVSARVIKPDGTIVELNKNDVFEREIAKSGGLKIKAKSFAVPNVEAGVILEYRYREVLSGGWANNMRLTFQHDIPIEDISYYFRPTEGFNVKYLSFNLNKSKFEKDKGGYYRATMTNVPALKEEAQMPPEDEIRSWMLVYYTRDNSTDTGKFWANVGGALAQVFDIKDTLKPSGAIKKAVPEIIGNAATDEEKIERLYTFCKTKIRNVTYDTSLTDDQKEQIKPNSSTTDTFKKMQGRVGDINELFASLVDAAGFEARIAFTGDKSKIFFSPKYAHASFVHPAAIAVKVDNKWKYYDPGTPFVSQGMLAWNEEDTAAFLLGSKDYVTTTTPSSGTDKTAAKRSGKFKLLEDGTLEGTVKIEYTGQLAYLYKSNNYDVSAAKREENLKDEIKKRMSTAEVSNVSVENVSDPEKPFVYAFKVRVPNYAQKTGKRLFLQPGFFEYGESPLFSSATRKYDIYFHYPWSEIDNIEIELPKGFALDNADTPGEIADPQKIGSLNINMGIDAASNTLVYKRRFYFGGGGNTLFPATAYQPLKNMFDAFNKADTHTITLKQS